MDVISTNKSVNIQVCVVARQLTDRRFLRRFLKRYIWVWVDLEIQVRQFVKLRGIFGVRLGNVVFQIPQEKFLAVLLKTAGYDY